MLAFPEMIKSMTPVKGIFKKGSSFRKHFLDKIGDLIAIIISIYLALSIEGWSEKRHEYKRLMNYYQNMVREIEADTASLNNAINDAEMHITNAGNHIKLLQSYNSDLKDSVSGMLSSMTVSTVFYSTNMITFKSMEMGGDIKLIDNLSLRDSLIKLDDGYIGVKINEDIYMEFVKNDIVIFLRDNYDLINGSLLNENCYAETKYRNMVFFFQALNSTRLSSYKEALPRAINVLDMLKKELAENI